MSIHAALTDYKAPLWLPSTHLQTIWGARIISVPQPTYQREWITTKDGQERLACDFVFSTQQDAPLVVMFHGLEGDSQSHYAKALMTKIKKKEINGLILHFRGCGGIPLSGKRAYHAGDSEEISWVLQQLSTRFKKIYACGVSLGGNMLAKYLGEQQNNTLCQAAVVVSAPLDLVASSVPLAKGWSKWLYTRDFLRTLKPKAYTLWQKHPDLFDWETIKKATSFNEFDSAFTAPLHGFKDAMDYWQQSSALPLLKNIRIPTLLLNAKNDPFVPAYSLPKETDVSSCVMLMQPEQGGHVGFVSGAFPGHVYWLAETILDFFEQF